MKRTQSAQIALWLLTLVLSACSGGSSDGTHDAGGGTGGLHGSGGSLGTGGSGSGGSGSGGSRDAGTAGSGGSMGEVDAGSAVMCGKILCAPGELCCNSCTPGQASCLRSCPGLQCPAACPGPQCPTNGVPCGPTMCAAGMSCCDHCTGSCVGATSGAFCPDDQNPTHACMDDAGAGMCAQTSESCLTVPCCAGLSCCSGVPIPQGEARCSGSVGGCPDSDYHLKAGFSAVESEAVLQGLLALPLSRWHYKREPAEVQHIGPMAQDFKETFGVGADDKHIYQVDADGVSYAAIQALARRIERLTAAQEALARDNTALREQIRRLEKSKAAR